MGGRMRHIDMKTLMPVVALSLALLAGGCASSASTSPGAGGSSAGSPPGATSSVDASGCPTAVTITATDASKTICVAVGGTVTVNLNGGGAWDALDVSGSNLDPSGTPSAEPNGQYATYIAKSAGTVDISSSHRACPSSPGKIACHAILAWKVTVEIK